MQSRDLLPLLQVRIYLLASLLFTSFTIAAAQPQQPQPLSEVAPVRRIELSKDGQGRFVHVAKGTSQIGDTVSFNVADIKDIMATLLVPETLRVTSSSQANELQGFGFDLASPAKADTLLDRLRGQRVQIVVEAKQLPVGTLLSYDAQSLRLKIDDGQSLVVRDVPRKDVHSLTIANPGESGLRQDLAEIDELLKRNQPNMRVLSMTGTMNHGDTIAYTHAMPSWSLHYRLDLSDNNAGPEEVRLLGWARIENTTTFDWNDVTVVLNEGANRQSLASTVSLPRGRTAMLSLPAAYVNAELATVVNAPDDPKANPTGIRAIFLSNTAARGAHILSGLLSVYTRTNSDERHVGTSMLPEVSRQAVPSFPTTGASASAAPAIEAPFEVVLKLADDPNVRITMKAAPTGLLTRRTGVQLAIRPGNQRSLRVVNLTGDDRQVRLFPFYKPSMEKDQLNLLLSQFSEGANNFNFNGSVSRELSLVLAPNDEQTATIFEIAEKSQDVDARTQNARTTSGYLISSNNSMIREDRDNIVRLHQAIERAASDVASLRSRLVDLRSREKAYRADAARPTSALRRLVDDAAELRRDLAAALQAVADGREELELYLRQPQ